MPLASGSGTTALAVRSRSIGASWAWVTRGPADRTARRLPTPMAPALRPACMPFSWLTPTSLERRVRNRHILLSVLRGSLMRFLRDPASLRSQLVKSVWIELKRYGAPHVKTVELADLIGT